MLLSKKNKKGQIFKTELIYISDEKSLCIWNHGEHGGFLEYLIENIDFLDIRNEKIKIFKNRSQLNYK